MNSMAKLNEKYRLILLLLMMSVTTVSVLCYIELRIRITAAYEQALTFERIKTQFSETGDRRKAERLLADYYPSGSKQRKDSKLDKIVELARSNALEHVTGRSLLQK